MNQKEFDALVRDAKRRLAAMHGRLDAEVAHALAERDAIHKTEVADLRKRIAGLESLPDPAQAPFRGSSVTGPTTLDAETAAFKVAQERGEREPGDRCSHI